MENKRLLIILITVSILLLIPFITMQFTDEVNWTNMDFAALGMLLLGTGLLCELILRIVTKRFGRIVLCVVVVSVFLLILAEIAVGILGTPFAGS